MGQMDSETDLSGMERLEKGGSNGQWNRLEWNGEAIYCGWLYFRGYQFSWIEQK